MRCPFCAHNDTQVKDSRPTEDNSAIRRRRHCPDCGARFTTFERVQLRDLTVLTKAGQKQRDLKPLERDSFEERDVVVDHQEPVVDERIEHRTVELVGLVPSRSPVGRHVRRRQVAGRG